MDDCEPWIDWLETSPLVTWPNDQERVQLTTGSNFECFVWVAAAILTVSVDAIIDIFSNVAQPACKSHCRAFGI